MPAEPTAYLVMCVHSTRRTRADALPGAREVRCEECHASILLSALTVAESGRRRVALYPVCPSCFIALTPPDELVADTLTVGGTAEVLEADGHADGGAVIAETAWMTVHDFARRTLRHTIG